MIQGRYANLVERFVEVLKISIHSVDYLSIVWKSFVSELFFEVWEQMVVAGGQIWRVWWMGQQLEF